MITDEQVKAALNAWNTGSHSSDNKAMRAALEAADAAAWRPISEAPKDGNHILVWRRKFLVMSAYWDANMQCWAHPVSRQTALIFEPTHFRPLPTPPKEPTK